MHFSLTQKIGLGIVLVFLLWSRLWSLSVIPATLTHDELVYAIQAKSFALQGTTLDQRQSFFTLQPSHPMYAEWPAQVMTPGFFFTQHPMISTHLMSVLMGISLPFLVASIAWTVWKRKDVAMAVWIVVSCNPLFWQMSRISYDAFFSLWFYVAAGALLVRGTSKSIMLSLPLFLIGFFQYQGFKLLLAPWILFLILLVVLQKIKSIKLTHVIEQIKVHKLQAFVLAFSLVLTIWYGLFLLPQQSAAGRLSSIIFSDEEYLSAIVNTERRLSLDNSFLNLASNKMTAIGYFMLDRLLGVFDPHLLLMSIEPNVSGFSVWTHGIFYWIEIILFAIGLGAVISNKKTRTSGLLFVGAILTMCLPALINSGSEWYLLRSMFSYLLILPVAAWGAVTLWQFKWLRYVLVAVYMISVLNFAYQYWYRYPIISLDWGNFDKRLIARYVDLTVEQNPNTTVTIFGDEAEYYYWAYLLYGNHLNTETADEIATVMQNNAVYSSDTAFSLGTVTFTSLCAPKDPQSTLISAPQGQDPGVILVTSNFKTCQENETNEKARNVIKSSTITEADGTRSIPAPYAFLAVLDSGQRLAIYGDKICQGNVTSFVDVQNHDQLKIEQQDAKTFCQNWIKDLSLVK